MFDFYFFNTTIVYWLDIYRVGDLTDGELGREFSKGKGKGEGTTGVWAGRGWEQMCVKNLE